MNQYSSSLSSSSKERTDARHSRNESHTVLTSAKPTRGRAISVPQRQPTVQQARDTRLPPAKRTNVAISIDDNDNDNDDDNDDDEPTPNEYAPQQQKQQP